jgi:MFS family permease
MSEVESPSSETDTPSLVNDRSQFEQPENASIGRQPYPAAFIGWYSTILLAFLYWFSILDRFIISLLVDPIKNDLGISDLQFGLLNGFAFAFTFSVFGLAAGALADRYSRRWVIFSSVTIWSVATTACGLAQNFWHMMLTRVGVGAGEAGLNPCATSMITDMFPRHRLTTALAVYAMGASLGSGCAYLFGGVIVDMVAAAENLAIPILGEIRSWQAAFFVVGIPGLVFSLLIFTIPEPVRRGQLQERSNESFVAGAFAGYSNLFQFIRSRGRFFAYHYGGFTFAAIVVIGSSSWYPAHMARTFDWSASEIGLSLGIALVAGSLLGKLLCGYFVDLMFRHGFRDAQFRWYAGCLFLSVPVILMATTSDNPWIFLTGISLFLVLVSAMPVCANASLNLVTPNELRGSGIAFYAATVGIIGGSLGPIAIAWSASLFFGGDANAQGIGYGIGTVAAICCPIAGVFMLLGLRPLREAMMEADTWSK